MSSATAPYPYFNGITYNPSFFSSSSSSTSLTQAQANLLYLRKTTADTATATETFSKIYLTEADSTALGNLSLVPSQTTGILNIGTGSRTSGGNGGGINIGTACTGYIPIAIGTTGQSITTLNGAYVNIPTKLITPIINTDGTSTDLEIGGNINQGQVNIATAQTTGTLNIGTGSRTTPGGGINIGTGSSSASSVNIGSGTSSTVLNGTYVQVTTKLQTPKIESIVNTGTIEIGNNQTSGLINIGTANTRTSGNINMGSACSLANQITIGTAATSTIRLQGLSIDASTKITTPILNSSAAGDNMTIGGNLDTGSITIGGLLSTGSITMGGVQTTGDINIGSSNATTDIYIGNGTNSTTGVNTGICSINKLQVGNTTSGSGVGTGTPYRCMIIGRAVGSTSSTTGTITIAGAPTTAGNPIVFASINTATITDPYFINVNPTGANTFTYYKVFYNKTSGTTVANAIVGATGETFNYVAIWL